MAKDTTVIIRKRPKEEVLNELIEQIDDLESFLRKEFTSTAELKAVESYLSDGAILVRFMEQTAKPFMKVDSMVVLNCIKDQIKILRKKISQIQKS